MPDDISDAIETAATDGVHSASVDGQTVQAKPIDELIRAKQFLAAETAMSGTNSNGGPRGAWGRVVRNRAAANGGGPQ